VGTSKLRIAVGQISSESNHFVSAPCELSLFRHTGYLLEGNDILDLKGSGTEVSGILRVLESASEIELVPLIAARANSSGPLSEDCYRYLRDNLVGRLRHALPVHGVILSHHGSMAAPNEDDPEGDIAEEIRRMLGPAVPLIITHDLHANVTRKRVEAANAIIGYEHYPHDDVFQTGERAARLLLRTLRREVSPVIGHAKLPLLLTAFNASTAWDTPYAQIMQAAKAMEKDPGILSTSVFLVGSYIDVPDIGCNAVVVADGDLDLAVRKARDLAEVFWARRREFEVETLSVGEAVRRGRKLDGGPVLLLDTADTTGGGSSGDSIGLVRGLLESEVAERSLAMVVDPAAAADCTRAGVGAELTLDLGHKLDPVWGRPLRVTGRIVRVENGQFQYAGGIQGGRWATMGPSAVFKVGNLEILIQTYPTYDWADEQYRAVGMNPDTAKFVGVKNMMNFRFGYGKVMKGFFVLNLPGPTPPDMRMLPFKRVRRPVFPLDSSLEEVAIRISTSRRLFGVA
jgi:microcystin degradation protein MlrC